MKLVESGLNAQQETDSKLRLATATKADGVDILKSTGGKKKRTVAGHELDATGIATQSEVVQLDQARNVMMNAVFNLQLKLKANAILIKEAIKKEATNS